MSRAPIAQIYGSDSRARLLYELGILVNRRKREHFKAEDLMGDLLAAIFPGTATLEAVEEILREELKLEGWGDGRWIRNARPRASRMTQAELEDRDEKEFREEEAGYDEDTF